MPTATDAPCGRCGHPWQAHEHFRSGTNCSLCPVGACLAFKKRRWIKRWFASKAG